MKTLEERLTKVIAQGLGLVPLPTTGSDIDQRLALDPALYRSLCAAGSSEAVNYCLKALRAWHASRAEIEKLKAANAADLTPAELDDAEREAAYRRAAEHVATVKADNAKRAELQRAQQTLHQARQAALGRR